ncbi:ABC transporter ATP-binding protein [Aquisalimonas lutea]|uniref:ABC transporter ATP-binding protein n=1 Tax=Aquisalimonas lutea TaxID=1327750 RepID=UPI0025B5F941|nr:ABC transporter ATP-binding protein [Aquisalimonas lutea]MDN3518211.1 ABC transporter ATP-binding protein [Aquisalimonas lutea]
MTMMRANAVADSRDAPGGGGAGAAAVAAPSVLELAGVSTFYGPVQALNDISLQVPQGHLVALVGANGAGKTTLLRTVSGLESPRTGSIHYCNEDITRRPPARRVRAGIAQVPEGRQVFAPMSVEDNLMLGAYTRSRREPLADELGGIYDMFPVLKEKRKLPAGTLSGGQQQMLVIGRALMARPRLLLLDEPSMGLAPLLVEEIFAKIRMLQEQGMTIFLVEQNASLALGMADYGYVLETGRVVMEGAGRTLLDDENVQRAYLGI